MPLVEREHGLTVLLTERNANLSAHAGQISFPGGSFDVTDPDRITTALRETEEEVGLPRNFVEVVGTLPDYITGTGFWSVRWWGWYAMASRCARMPARWPMCSRCPCHF